MEGEDVLGPSIRDASSEVLSGSSGENHVLSITNFSVSGNEYENPPPLYTHTSGASPLQSPSPPIPPAPSSITELFQNNLDVARLELASHLPPGHGFFRRICRETGKLFPTQPRGRPRLPYNEPKAARKIASKGIEDPPTALERSRLIDMWNSDLKDEEMRREKERSKSKMSILKRKHRLREVDPNTGKDTHGGDRMFKKRKKNHELKSEAGVTTDKKTAVVKDSLKKKSVSDLTKAQGGASRSTANQVSTSNQVEWDDNTAQSLETDQDVVAILRSIGSETPMREGYIMAAENASWSVSGSQSTRSRYAFIDTNLLPDFPGLDDATVTAVAMNADPAMAGTIHAVGRSSRELEDVNQHLATANTSGLQPTNAIPFESSIEGADRDRALWEVSMAPSHLSLDQECRCPCLSMSFQEPPPGLVDTRMEGRRSEDRRNSNIDPRLRMSFEE